MEDLKESLDQKRRELVMHTQVGEEEETAISKISHDFQRYSAQEEGILDEQQRLRQPARRDPNRRAPNRAEGMTGARSSAPQEPSSGQAPPSSGSAMPQPSFWISSYTPSPPPM